MVKNFNKVSNMSFYSMINSINQKERLRAGCGKAGIKPSKCTSCSICLESKSQNSIKLVCGHTFHKICFSHWVKHSLNYSCPLCRKDSKSIFTKIEDTNKSYKLFIKRFLFKEIKLLDNQGNLILNINCKNIHQLLNYNYKNVLEKYYDYNNKVFKSNKVLFEIDNIKISQFLRDIIIFGPNKITIEIKKENTNDQEFYYDTKLDIINNYNKKHFHDNYSLYEKIYQLLEQKIQKKFTYQHMFHIWDLAFQYAGKNKVNIFKIIRYMLVEYINCKYDIDFNTINNMINSISNIVLYQIPLYQENEYHAFKVDIKKNMSNIINGIVKW